MHHDERSSNCLAVNLANTCKHPLRPSKWASPLYLPLTSRGQSLQHYTPLKRPWNCRHSSSRSSKNHYLEGDADFLEGLPTIVYLVLSIDVWGLSLDLFNIPNLSRHNLDAIGGAKYLDMTGCLARGWNNLMLFLISLGVNDCCWKLHNSSATCSAAKVLFLPVLLHFLMAGCVP